MTKYFSSSFWFFGNVLLSLLVGGAFFFNLMAVCVTLLDETIYGVILAVIAALLIGWTHGKYGVNSYPYLILIMAILAFFFASDPWHAKIFGPASIILLVVWHKATPKMEEMEDESYGKELLESFTGRGV